MVLASVQSRRARFHGPEVDTMSFLPDSKGFGPGERDWDIAERKMDDSIRAFDSGVFTEGRKTWMDLGVVIPDDAITAEQALGFAKLAGWQLEKHPAFIEVDGVRIEIPGRFGHLRRDTMTVLGDVGKTYTSLQNEMAFDWANALVGGEGCHFKTAISLDGGARVCLQLEVPFEVNLPDGKLRSFLYLSNSHDGSSSIQAGFWNERIVCRNTLKLAKRGGIDKVNIKHTASAEKKLAEAQKALGLAEGAAERAEKLAIAMYRTKLTRQDVEDVITEVFPMAPGVPQTAGERRSATIAMVKRDAVRAVYAGDEGGQDEIRGTAWGVYNAFAAVATHQTASTVSQAESIFKNLMAGDTAADRALELLAVR